MESLRASVFTSVRGVLIFAAVIYLLAIVDLATRHNVEPLARAKLAFWLAGTAAMMFRILRVVRKAEGDPTRWGDAERTLVQLAALMPIAGMFPLSLL